MFFYRMKYGMIMIMVWSFFGGVDEIAYEMGQDFENEMIWGDFFIAHFKGCRFMFHHPSNRLLNWKPGEIILAKELFDRQKATGISGVSFCFMPDRKDISSWHAALLDAHLFCKKRCSLKTQAPPSLRLLSRICGSTDHSIMLVGGVLLLCVGVLGFLCLCSYAALKVPEWSAMEMLSLFSAQKLGGSRFLGASFYFCIHKKTGFSRLGCIFFIF